MRTWCWGCLVFEPTLADAISDYLDGLGTTLWGRAWDISDDVSRAQAIAWFEDTIVELYTQMTSGDGQLEFAL